MTLISWLWINIISKMTMSSTSFLRGHMPKLGVSLFFWSIAQTRRKKLGTSFWDWFIKQIKPTIRVFDKNIFCFRRCKIPCNFNFPRIFLFFHFHLLYALHATTSFKDPHLTPHPDATCMWLNASKLKHRDGFSTCNYSITNTSVKADRNVNDLFICSNSFN